MLYHVSIHRPTPEHEDDVIDSMHRFGAAARTQDGLLEVHTLKDRRSGALIGLAVWDSAEALEAARPALAAATEHDDFDAWEAAPVEGFLRDEV
jgi:heme-degrading monooxygenase HmoA